MHRVITRINKLTHAKDLVSYLAYSDIQQAFAIRSYSVARPVLVTGDTNVKDKCRDRQTST